MILYAIKDKNSQKYWRYRQENGIELLDLDHCSVFKQRHDAQCLSQKFGRNDAELVEIRLTTSVIPW